MVRLGPWTVAKNAKIKNVQPPGTIENAELGENIQNIIGNNIEIRLI